MSEDDLLAEFGFNVDVAKPKSRGRGKIDNLKGVEFGTFVCDRRHEENKSSGESQWVLVCKCCGVECVASSSVVKHGKKKCQSCTRSSPAYRRQKPKELMEPRPKDYATRFAMLKKQIHQAIEKDDDEKLMALVWRLRYAAKKCGKLKTE